MKNIYVDQQQGYTSEPVPEYVIPANRVYPSTSGIQQLPYRGSQGPYGMPGNASVSAGIGGGTPDTTSANAYGQAAASSPPTQQPVFWMIVAMAIGFTGLAWGAHIRVKA